MICSEGKTALSAGLVLLGETCGQKPECQAASSGTAGLALSQGEAPESILSAFLECSRLSQSSDTQEESLVKGGVDSIDNKRCSHSLNASQQQFTQNEWQGSWGIQITD